MDNLQKLGRGSALQCTNIFPYFSILDNPVKCEREYSFPGLRLENVVTKKSLKLFFLTVLRISLEQRQFVER